jgi:SAM-dependent methyltransferase
MSSNKRLEDFLDIVVNQGLYANRGRLRFHLNYVFKNIDFLDKNVLDIGGGVGLLSFYAASMGAKKVICLEPQIEGSSSGVTEAFDQLNNKLGYSEIVSLQRSTFQDFAMTEDQFNIVISHNSINHLDEEACIHLLDDSDSKERYKLIFQKLSTICAKGGKLIVCDCSRDNFFDLVKLKNPFAPSIEWEKHQAPDVWVSLLKEHGFANEIVRWTSHNFLRSFGRVIVGNRLMQYFIMSHFCFSMEKI